MIKIKLGDYNDLTVQKVAYREGKGERFGLYLDGGRDGEILMPDKYVPEGTQVGDTLRVFVYLDQEERPIATTEKPLARVDEFAYLQCAWVNQYGAFLHWGVMKDLFCPFREQKKRMEVGLKYIVHIHADEESYRLVASAKVEHYLHDYAEDYDAAARRGEIEAVEEADADAAGFRPYHVGDEVELLVWQKTDLGFKVIVDNRYPALIYEDQIFQYVHTGDRLRGFISRIREDGKLDCSLQPTGKRQTQDFADTLLAYLQAHDGRCPLGDKSDSEDIKRVFHVSKKVFKRAVGDLYKRRLVIPGPTSVVLTK